MTMAQAELVGRFYDGSDGGVASSMEIAEMPGGGVAVIGYEHAVYAYRPPDGRFKPVVFEDWASASRSSAQHIAKLKRGDYIVAPGAAKKTDVYGDPDLEELMALSGNHKDYGGYHGAIDRRRA